MNLWIPYTHPNPKGGFTCDNWYCRRGFLQGYRNDGLKRILCTHCYNIYIKKKEGNFEFTKLPQN